MYKCVFVGFSTHSRTPKKTESKASRWLVVRHL